MNFEWKKVVRRLCAGAGAMAALMGLGSAANAAAPANNNFSAASGISGLVGGVSGSNVDATGEGGEPYADNHTVWYRWTAPAGGIATFDTFGSDFDSYLEIYTGTSVSNLNSIAEGEGVSGTDDDRAVFQAVPGTTYSIQVANDASYEKPGNLKLNWNLVVSPSNDNFAKAFVLNGSSGAVTGSNIAATGEGGESLADNHTVWYRWTAPSDGMATFDTFGSDFRSYLEIYTGTSVSNLNSIAEGEGVSGTDDKRATFQAVAGTTYSIQVLNEEYFHNPGNLKLNWTSEGSETHSLSGQVRILNSANLYVGVMGATVTLSNGATFTTGYDGYYFFSGLPNANYSVSAVLAGFTITPSGFSNPVNPNGENLTGLNFNAVKNPTTPRFSVSGKVVLYVPNSLDKVDVKGLSGVLVSALGDDALSTRTDASGNFTLAGLENGDYVIAPSKNGYKFDRSVEVRTIEGKNLVVGFKTYTIYGLVYRLSGTTKVPLSGASIFINGTKRGTTGSDGKYKIHGIPAGLQKVTATLSGHTFPTNRSVTVNGNVQIGKVDFQSGAPNAAMAPDPSANAS